MKMALGKPLPVPSGDLKSTRRWSATIWQSRLAPLILPDSIWKWATFQRIAKSCKSSGQQSDGVGWAVPTDQRRPGYPQGVLYNTDSAGALAFVFRWARPTLRLQEPTAAE